MEEANAKPPGTLAEQFTALTLAVKIGFLAVALGISYFNIRLAWMLPKFDQMFRDMLGGKPLPSLTTAVLKCHLPLLGLSICILAGALGAFFHHRPVWAVFIISGALLAAIIQLVITWQAITMPFVQIIELMQGAG